MYIVLSQISETVRGHEREKARLASLQQTDREAWEAERQREVDRLHQEAEESVHLSEMRASEQHERDVQVTRDLEATLARLREELAQSNQLRKEQLLELGILREEEKQRLTRDHEQQVTSLCRYSSA